MIREYSKNFQNMFIDYEFLRCYYFNIEKERRNHQKSSFFFGV